MIIFNKFIKMEKEFKTYKEDIHTGMYKHKKGWLSKSQIQLFLQCPLKWKFIYVDELTQVVSEQRARGTAIHQQIENFYNDIELINSKDKITPIIIAKKDKILNSTFYNFEKERIKSCLDKEGNFNIKYFNPLHQELKINNEKIRVRGIIDAVYVNSGDDKLIVIDWKTGKYRKDDLDKYRFELALYKYLYEQEYKQEVGYWGIYFIDANKLFFEKVEQKYVDKALATVFVVRNEIEREECLPTPNQYCYNCEFKDRCTK